MTETKAPKTLHDQLDAIFHDKELAECPEITMEMAYQRSLMRQPGTISGKASRVASGRRKFRGSSDKIKKRK